MERGIRYRWTSTSTSSSSGEWTSLPEGYLAHTDQVLWVCGSTVIKVDRVRMYLAVALFFITNLFSLYRLSEFSEGWTVN